MRKKGMFGVRSLLGVGVSLLMILTLLPGSGTVYAPEAGDGVIAEAREIADQATNDAALQGVTNEDDATAEEIEGQVPSNGGSSDTSQEVTDGDDDAVDESGTASGSDGSEEIRDDGNACHEDAYHGDVKLDTHIATQKFVTGVPLYRVLYDYKPSRAGECPAGFLKGFDGYLHTDGYSAYHTKLPESIKISGCWAHCWAHARRKFFDALSAMPEKDPIRTSIWSPSSAPRQIPPIPSSCSALEYSYARLTLAIITFKSCDMSNSAKYYQKYVSTRWSHPSEHSILKRMVSKYYQNI